MDVIKKWLQSNALYVNNLALSSSVHTMVDIVPNRIKIFIFFIRARQKKYVNFNVCYLIENSYEPL